MKIRHLPAGFDRRKSAAMDNLTPSLQVQKSLQASMQIRSKSRTRSLQTNRRVRQRRGSRNLGGQRNNNSKMLKSVKHNGQWHKCVSFRFRNRFNIFRFKSCTLQMSAEVMWWPLRANMSVIRMCTAATVWSTEGADCSYFRHGMFRTVWNLTSEKLLFHASCGQAVSYDCAQPGDIICFHPGHVFASIWKWNGRACFQPDKRNLLRKCDVSYDPDDTTGVIKEL